MGAMKEKIKKFPFTSKRSKDDIIFNPQSGSIPKEFLSELLDKCSYTIPSDNPPQLPKLKDKKNLEVENQSKSIDNNITKKEYTKINKIIINKFRGLENITLPIANNITLIAGRNGTSKSTILGIVAQCFNFMYDYTKPKKNEKNRYQLLPYRTLAGRMFISVAKEHFRLSEQHDLTGTMDITVEIYDAINHLVIDSLKLSLTREKNKKGEYFPRARVRQKESGRAITHPVIYLGLKRLYPISERRYEEKENDEFIIENKKDFISDNNLILIKRSSEVTSTLGIVNSIVAHNTEYDHQSISVGEDNVGQILQAIYSFKKLKNQMKDEYKGGILLIDEIDSSLFCAAQIRLMSLLERYSKELQLQIIITSHSLDIIEKIYKSSRHESDNFKLLYLTNARGKIQLLSEFSEISADIQDAFPDRIYDKPINVYTEDQEARDFLNSLIANYDIKSKLNLIQDIKIGCENYKKFVTLHKIPEFYKHSIIIFDGDLANDETVQKHENLICLPTNLPPEQLLLEYLLNKPDDDPFWETCKISRSTIISMPQITSIINRLHIDIGSQIELRSDIDMYRKSDKANEKPKLREVFKQWYNTKEIQTLIKQANLYEHWINDHQSLQKTFLDQLSKAIRFVQKNTSHF
ncbi:AAA family ATPase [Pasteurella multocida]|nr:AAA family ATPase [Pasteurella multocida]